MQTRLVAAPDKFRGTATAQEVTNAIATAATDMQWAADLAPMADGGEGTIAVVEGALVVTTVTGPLGEPVDAPWTLAGDLAVIEMAQASGHIALAGAAPDALGATTRGTGELIAAAMDAGAKRIVVGAGGSVTTDGGWGAIDVLQGRLPLVDVDIVVATDVRTLFRDCARIYGPQKGASAGDIAVLETRLDALAQRYQQHFNVDVHTMPGAGAAGGLAGGLAAIGARIVPGFDYLAGLVDLESRIASADVVITGEGKFDFQSTQGKVVDGVVRLARKHAKPVLLVAGVSDRRDIPETFFGNDLTVVSLVEVFGEERALQHTTDCITDAVQEFLRAFTPPVTPASHRQ